MGKKIKILMVSPFFYPRIGGVEKHVFSVCSCLVKKGFDVTVATMMHERLPEQELINGINIRRCINVKKFSLSSVFLFWLWLFKNIEIITHSDIIHVHDAGTFLFYVPFRILFFWKPTYITFHGYEGIYPIPKKFVILRRFAELLTNGNICVGEFLEKYYGTKTKYVIYGGVDIPEKVSYSKNNIAVFVGRIDCDTGISDYVKAIKIVNERYGKEVYLRVYGHGSLKEKISKRDFTEMMGDTLNSQKCFSEGRFAFASGYLAILEAMASKRLVFSIFNNKLKEDYLKLIPDSSKMMVICSSPEDLAEKIDFYIKHPEEEQSKIEKAFAFALENTWESVTNIYISLWKL